MKAISLSVVVIAATALLTSAGAATNGGSISLVAYSTPNVAYSQIIPAFQKTAAGKGVSFSQSYGPSGDQAQAASPGSPGSGARGRSCPRGRGRPLSRGGRGRHTGSSGDCRAGTWRSRSHRAR